VSRTTTGFPSTLRHPTPFVVQREGGDFLVGRASGGGLRWDPRLELARRWVHHSSAETAARALGGQVVDLTVGGA
jgi:hypothetical protein